jgi:CRISPR-associated protein Csx16
MTTWFISRHPGAIEWAKQQGLSVDRVVAHLEPAVIATLTPGDVVLGILPVNLAYEVCSRGCTYYHLALELPADARGKELTAEEMNRYCAKLIRYHISTL